MHCILRRARAIHFFHANVSGPRGADTLIPYKCIARCFFFGPPYLCNFVTLEIKKGKGWGHGSSACGGPRMFVGGCQLGHWVRVPENGRMADIRWGSIDTAGTGTRESALAECNWGAKEFKAGSQKLSKHHKHIALYGTFVYKGTVKANQSVFNLSLSNLQ